jgi:cytoskeleton protein RodZ
MSKTPNTLSDDTANAPVSVLGGTLRLARESLGLSVEDVAQQLRMSRHQINALEEDNFSVLSSPAFVRGFIRNYARLLKLPADSLVAAYKAMQPEDSASVAIRLQSENITIVNNSRRTMMMYLLASVLVVVVGISWWAYQDWREKLPATPKLAVKAAPKLESNQPVTPTTPVHEPTLYVPITEPVPVLVPNPEAPVTQGDIRMKFIEQTWVSVTDSTGKDIFNKTMPAESEDFASGTPPFNVVVGNAVGVLVFYKGKPFDIYPYTKANVARFTLD